MSYKCENEAEKVIPADLDKDSNFKIEVKCVDGALKVSAQSLNGWPVSYLTRIHYSSYFVEFNNLHSVFSGLATNSIFFCFLFVKTH